MKVHRLIFSPFEVNTYIITDKSKECIIIDPACNNTQEKEHLSNFITENDLKPKKLINTHCHLDHVFGNKYVCDTYNLETEASKEEDFNIKNAVNAANLYGVKMDKPYPIKKFLKESDKITFGFSELSVLHVPGHTSGSLVFHNEEEKIAIVGDVLFNGSIGRTDLPGGDYDTLVSHIKTKLFILDKNTFIYSGHGIPTTIGKEIESNPFFSDSLI